ncbi:MAG: DUF2155 domain-containing protein [Beijerinckiaceae bacterium]
MVTFRISSSIFVLAAASLALAGSPAFADKFRNPTAVFAGLDKITGRIISFEVAVNETVQFGALQLTPKVCYSRPAAEKPQTTGFVEVDEITLNNESKRLFNGWMFASSPGLNAIEHPVYDIWLTGCKGATQRDLIKTPVEEEEVVAAPSNENALARPLGPDGKPQLDPAERAAERAAADRRRAQQINRSTSAGPILPGQPLSTAPSGQVIRPTPSQRFFPLPGGAAPPTGMMESGR